MTSPSNNISKHNVDLARFGQFLKAAGLISLPPEKWMGLEVVEVIKAAVNCACVWPPDIERLIDWLRSVELPDEEIRMATIIRVNAREYQKRLLADVDQGPSGPRAYLGGLQADLREMWVKYGKTCKPEGK